MSASEEEDEIWTERCEYYCSVANDCTRTAASVLTLKKCPPSPPPRSDLAPYSLDEPSNSNSSNTSERKGKQARINLAYLGTEELRIYTYSSKLQLLYEQAVGSFQSVAHRAVEKISSTMFKVVCTEGDWVDVDVDVHLKWLPPAPTPATSTVTAPTSTATTTTTTTSVNNAPTTTIAATTNGSNGRTSSFTLSLIEICDWLDARVEYLEPSVFAALVRLTLEKVVMRYLHMLRIAALRQRHFSTDSIEVAQIEADLNDILNKLTLVLDGVGTANDNFSETLKESRYNKLIIHVYLLLSSPLISSDLDAAFMYFDDEAKAHRCDALACSHLVSCILSLRSDTGGFFTLVNNSSTSKGSQGEGKNKGTKSPLGQSEGSTRGVESSRQMDSSAHGSVGQAEPSSKDTTSTLGIPVVAVKKPSTFSRLSHYMFHSKSTDPNGAPALDPATTKRLNEIQKVVTNIGQNYDQTLDTNTTSSLYRLFHPPFTTTIPLSLLLFDDHRDLELTKTALEDSDRHRRAVTDASQQPIKLSINNLALTNIHGVHKLKPLLIFEINGVKYKSPIATADPASEQYIWRDYTLEIPVDNTVLSSHSLAVELRYVGCMSYVYIFVQLLYTKIFTSDVYMFLLRTCTTYSLDFALSLIKCYMHIHVRMYRYKGRVYGTDKIGAVHIPLSSLHVSSIG